MGETSKKRVRANTNPDPEATPHVPEEQNVRSSSRQNASKEPMEDEEKRRVAKKLRERD